MANVHEPAIAARLGTALARSGRLRKGRELIEVALERQSYWAAVLDGLD
ncbi:MAG: hypothetical protein OEZ06_04435 [Myxococcales bacterium]|nr:hypothetical protein [Myxococcales bacterium]